MIKVSSVSKSYGNLQVLKNINLEVANEEIVCLVGASGAGKSTLLHIMGTLDKPDKGKVIIDEQDVFAMSDKALSKYRNQHIGFVFQFHHLLPEFTAIENIYLPAIIGGKSKSEAEKVDAVSGATLTSEAYKKAIKDAFDIFEMLNESKEDK